jgi:hypothetical protein
MKTRRLLVLALAVFANVGLAAANLRADEEAVWRWCNCDDPENGNCCKVEADKCNGCIASEA